MGYFQILAVVVVVTVITLWKMNALLGVVSGVAWFGLLTYHLANPPVGVTQGDNLDNILVMVYAGMGMAILIMSISVYRSYGWDLTGSRRSSGNRIQRKKGELDMSEDEYKAHIRRPSRR